MLKTLRLSLSLKNTYRVNSILYAIKQIPFIKTILPDSVYSEGGLKAFANVLSVIWAVIKTFLSKFLYFFLFFFVEVNIYGLPQNTEAAVFLHIIIMLTVIGAFINNLMFDPSKETYYAVVLLSMDARRYTLFNYAFSLLRLMLGFAASSLLFGLMFGLGLPECLLIPLFAAGVKLCSATCGLKCYEKKGSFKSKGYTAFLKSVLLVILLVAAYALPALGCFLPKKASLTIMCLAVLAGVLSLKKIITFKSYRAAYKELLTDALKIQMDDNTEAKLAKERSRNSISADGEITSNKKGFEYLNELFVKRHRKILWRSAERIALCALAIIAVLVVLALYLPAAKAGINEAVMSVLPVFFFVMYILNRGTGFTQALFINCDSSLLTYPFYKEPKSILKLFTIRLREIIKVNLLPAVVIGGGMAFLLFVSGGTDNPLNYAVLLVSVMSMSVFFSVHYLMLYYLLQPYNAGTEIKSGTYKLAMWATYMLCYIFMQMRFPTLIFGAVTIAFCVIYSAAASALVYKLASKTFKIRA